MSSVLGLWDVVSNLTKLTPSRRDRYRVTIFGSARVTPGTFGYDETKRVAATLAAMGCDIITGGGPGLMQAANEGAASEPKRARSIGIRVDLPFEQDVNAFVTQAFEHLRDIPLILVGKMWPPLVAWARDSMLSADPPLANPEDMTIPRCAANADEAIAIIREHHGAWLRARKA